MNLGLGTLITIGVIGIGSMVLQKILDVAGLQSYSQVVGICGVSIVSLTVINIVVKVFQALRGLA